MHMDFRHIRATPLSQRDSFEALATYLFQRNFLPGAGSTFTNLRGDGGDGGVEAYFTDAAGYIHGLQAKFFFKLGSSEQAQLAKSLKAAQQNYPALQSYTIYIPFDLTGRRAGGTAGKAELERFEAWATSEMDSSLRAGAMLEIRLVPGTQVKQQLLASDPHGGARRFWFDDAVLTPAVISTCLSAAKAFAGPRFTETLDVETEAQLALSIFGRTADAAKAAYDKFKPLVSPFNYLTRKADEALACLSPSDLKAAKAALAAIVANLRSLVTGQSEVRIVEECSAAALTLTPLLAKAEELNFQAFCDTHGKDKDTKAFRQFNAEFMVAFPAKDLDIARESVKALAQLAEALNTPAVRAATAKSMLLVGPAGVGKTHAIVSSAADRLARGAFSVVLFGDDFEGASPWEVVRSRLGFGANVGRDELFECLDACAVAQGYPFVVFIDALNEGPMGSKWKDRLPEFLSQAAPYPGVKVCVSTRDTYRDLVVDSRFPGFAFRHPGFEGREFEALQAFANHYGLLSEITPLFTQEASNPLFLHLACRTMKEMGATSLDLTLDGFSGLFEKFLEQVNVRVKERLRVVAPGHLVRRALIALSGAIKADGSVGWSDASAQLVSLLHGESTAPALLEELRKEGLVILSSTASGDHVVRFGYQRYGDVLRCLRLIEAATNAGFLDQPALVASMANADDGLLEMMAAVLPERAGVELPFLGLQLADDELGRHFLKGFQWRRGSSVSPATELLFRQQLLTPDWQQVFDTALRLSLVPNHPLNARWFHELMLIQSSPLREGYLWLALRDSYASGGVVKSIVDTARRADLKFWTTDIFELACKVLITMCTSPDRRVRDLAGKGLTRLLIARPELAAALVETAADFDDEFVLESAATATYCACLLVPTERRKAFLDALDVLLSNAAYDTPNAAIRNSVLLLGSAISPLPGDLARALKKYPSKDKLPAAWPTEAEAHKLLEVKGVVQNMDFDSKGLLPDFWRYQVEPELRNFDLKKAGLKEVDLARWLMCEVLRLGYPGRDEVAANYDRWLVHKVGFGRSHPAYAERIGKKLAWIALDRLVGMLSDNLDPKPDWDGKPRPKRLLELALRVRKADLSDMRDLVERPSYPEAIFTAARYPFPTDDDHQWVDRDDLTSHDNALIRTDADGVQWFALWLSIDDDDQHPASDSSSTPYRCITFDYWTTFHPTPFNWKARRNAVHSALSSSGHSCYRAFVAEYPRERAYEHCLFAGDAYESEGKALHSYASLLRGREWEYDYSWEDESKTLRVPAGRLVKELGLVWDQHSGWNDQDGRLAAFHMDVEDNEGLLIRKDLLDRFLRASGMVLCARRFVRRFKASLGTRNFPQRDSDAYLCYSPNEGLQMLEEESERFEGE